MKTHVLLCGGKILNVCFRIRIIDFQSLNNEFMNLGMYISLCVSISAFHSLFDCDLFSEFDSRMSWKIKGGMFFI